MLLEHWTLFGIKWKMKRWKVSFFLFRTLNLVRLGYIWYWEIPQGFGHPKGVRHVKNNLSLIQFILKFGEVSARWTLQGKEPRTLLWLTQFFRGNAKMRKFSFLTCAPFFPAGAWHTSQQCHTTAIRHTDFPIVIVASLLNCLASLLFLKWI